MQALIIEQTLRRERSRLVAQLYRLARDLELVEEAVQEASLEATVQWARDGLPDNPGAWLHVVARRRTIDLLRRRRDDDDLEHWVATATRAYVLFALDRPAHFRLMFRPELADMDRFPQRSAAAREAHARLRSLAGATLPSSAEASEIDVRATYLWSLSHGLATLMLDSAHGRSLGTGARARIDAVTRLGASLLTQPAPRTRKARR